MSFPQYQELETPFGVSIRTMINGQSEKFFLAKSFCGFLGGDYTNLKRKCGKWVKDEEGESVIAFNDFPTVVAKLGSSEHKVGWGERLTWAQKELPQILTAMTWRIEEDEVEVLPSRSESFATAVTVRSMNIGGETRDTINSRDLYEKLQDPRPYMPWWNRQIFLNQEKFKENEEFAYFGTDCFMSIRMALHIILQAQTEPGYQAREEVIALQKKFEELMHGKNSVVGGPGFMQFMQKLQTYHKEVQEIRSEVHENTLTQKLMQTEIMDLRAEMKERDYEHAVELRELRLENTRQFEEIKSLLEIRVEAKHAEAGPIPEPKLKAPRVRGAYQARPIMHPELGLMIPVRQMAVECHMGKIYREKVPVGGIPSLTHYLMTRGYIQMDPKALPTVHWKPCQGYENCMRYINGALYFTVAFRDLIREERLEIDDKLQKMVQAEQEAQANSQVTV